MNKKQLIEVAHSKMSARKRRARYLLKPILGESKANMLGCLTPIRILGSRRDVIQDFYMYFDKNLYKWELAQYFTPTEVVDCVVEVINPQPGNQVKDPACGSADFLISTLRLGTDRGWDAADSIFGADNSSQAVQ